MKTKEMAKGQILQMFLIILVPKFYFIFSYLSYRISQVHKPEIL